MGNNAPADGRAIVPCFEGELYYTREIRTSACFDDLWIGERDPRIDDVFPVVQPARDRYTFSVFELNRWMRVGDAFAIALGLPNDHSMVWKKLFAERRLWTLSQIDQLIARQMWCEETGLHDGGNGSVFPVVDNDVRLSFVTVHRDPHCAPGLTPLWKVDQGPSGLDVQKYTESRIFLINSVIS